MSKKKTEKQKTKEPTELEQKESRIKELEETLMRTQADYANYRRRTEEEKQKMRKLAAKRLLQEILGVADNLELALKQVQEETQLSEGVKLVLAQLITILENEGVQRIEETTFDPKLHEALLTEESDKPKGTILELLQPGYKLEDTVLRTAKVKIAKPKEETK